VKIYPKLILNCGYCSMWPCVMLGLDKRTSCAPMLTVYRGKRRQSWALVLGWLFGDWDVMGEHGAPKGSRGWGPRCRLLHQAVLWSFGSCCIYLIQCSASDETESGRCRTVIGSWGIKRLLWTCTDSDESNMWRRRRCFCDKGLRRDRFAGRTRIRASATREVGQGEVVLQGHLTNKQRG